ncbi:methionyl-tRNA formyltransferase [Microbacterium sp. 2P01SA-2]|uniref:methionyl-tRNA formyltransferase n=1 Tax=unclassified Microbacterium TaxID=2609290 RepID=UPI0039A3B1D4
MRIVFAGTPEPALPSLRRLAASRHEIVGVVTRRDAPLGRKRVLTPSPVVALAAELGLPILKTDRLDAEATQTITAWGADLGVIVAYGGLVREPLLSAPPHGWINLHFSLLPAWRGAAPVQHSLIAGDRMSGVSVFRLVPELDAGDVFAQTRHPVDRGATAGDLLAQLADVGAQTVAAVVDGIADGTATAVPQSGEPSLAPKLTLGDGLLDFALPADVVLDRFRGTTPEPGAHTTIAGQRLKILAARRGADADLAPREIRLVGKEVLVGTADGTIALQSVQPAGRGAMPAPDWWRGQRVESVEAGS